jgi:hypothetical protein
VILSDFTQSLCQFHREKKFNQDKSPFPNFPCKMLQPGRLGVSNPQKITKNVIVLIQYFFNTFQHIIILFKKFNQDKSNCNPRLTNLNWLKCMHLTSNLMILEYRALLCLTYIIQTI